MVGRVEQIIKGLKSESKQLMFDAVKKGEANGAMPTGGAYIFKVMGQENHVCSSILNGYKQSKIVFSQAKEKDGAVIKTQADENLDGKFSCGEESIGKATS